MLLPGPAIKQNPADGRQIALPADALPGMVLLKAGKQSYGGGVDTGPPDGLID
jgi:hypothetical protein